MIKFSTKSTCKNIIYKAIQDINTFIYPSGPTIFGCGHPRMKPKANTTLWTMERITMTMNPFLGVIASFRVNKPPRKAPMATDEMLVPAKKISFKYLKTLKLFRHSVLCVLMNNKVM